MLTVLVTNTKGGCGKTTIATGLAGAFATAGYRTALADVDKQKSALDWIRRRTDAVTPILGVDWTKDIGKPPRKIDRLVIDAPAALRRRGVKELIQVADVVVLPILPSVFDEQATRKFLKTLDALKPIKKGKRPVAVVGNRIRGHTKAAAHLEAFLEGTEHQVVTRLRDSLIYATAAETGTTVFDMNGKRAEGYRQDWRPLLRFIEER